MDYGQAAKFFNRVARTDEDGCWYWTGRITPDGYGRFRLPGQPEAPAHVLAYEHAVGPVPDQLVLDHLCHTRAIAAGTCHGGPCPHRRCVNPTHLEPVTVAVNIARSDHAGRRRTACSRCGRPYLPDNLIVTKSGARRCLACDRARRRPG